MSVVVLSNTVSVQEKRLTSMPIRAVLSCWWERFWQWINWRFTTLSLWYNQVQKLHQGRLDLDLDLSVNDVTTLVQHVTFDLAGATRPTHRHLEFWECRRSFKRSWISCDSLSRTNICGEAIHVTRQLASTTICRAYTSTRDAKGSQPFGIKRDNTVIGPAVDVQVTLQYGRYCTEIKINSADGKYCLLGGRQPRIRQTEGNTNSTSTRTRSPTVLDKSGTRKPVAAKLLSVSSFSALLTYLTGRANYVAVENYP